MSYIVNLQHIIFRTYRSRMTLPNETKRVMFKYIHELCKSNGWYIKRINSCLNHVHILINIDNSDIPTVVKKIKSNSSRVFHHHPCFPNFEKWAKKYAAFSVSFMSKEGLIEYIKNQETHHLGESFEDEMRRLFRENGLDGVEDFFNDEENV